jgi:hypothetical protein
MRRLENGSRTLTQLADPEQAWAYPIGRELKDVAHQLGWATEVVRVQNGREPSAIYHTTEAYY